MADEGLVDTACCNFREQVRVHTFRHYRQYTRVVTPELLDSRSVMLKDLNCLWKFAIGS